MNRPIRILLGGTAFGLVALFGVAFWYGAQEPCDNDVSDLVDSERYVGDWVLEDGEGSLRNARLVLRGAEELSIELVGHVEPGVARVRLSIGDTSAVATLSQRFTFTELAGLAFDERPAFLGADAVADGAVIHVQRCLYTTRADHLDLWLVDRGDLFRNHMVFARKHGW